MQGLVFEKKKEELLWVNAFIPCKDWSLVLVYKTLIDSSQAGSIGGVTRLREFWEEERQR